MKIVNENNIDEMNILLTIAIPTYNRVNYLRRAVNSILPQLKDGKVEIVISDNASTDGTEEFVKQSTSHYPQIKYIRNKINIGPDGNFLQCYKVADGRYVWLLGDDDVIVEGAIQKILNYIKTSPHSPDLIFLNHVFFEKQYHGLKYCTEPFWGAKEDKMCQSKTDFMRIARYQLTYMSAFLLRKNAFLQVQNPERYMGTSFIHTCIAFEATQNKDVDYGAIAYPCVAQNVSYEESGFAAHPEKVFRIFGEKEEYVYCELAPTFGYDKEQMGEIYSDFILSSWPKTILSLKAKGNKFWREEYETYGKPALLKHPKAYKKIKFYVLFPAWLAKVLRKIKRGFQRTS